MIKKSLILLLLLGLALSSCGGIAKRKMAKQKGLPLCAYLNIDNINTAGGVDVYESFSNLTNKTLKYVYLTIEAYNAVGDKQKGSVRRKYKSRLAITGPILPGGHDSGRFANVWYNGTIICLKLVSVEVVFINGERIKYTNQEDLDFMTYESEGLCE